MNQEYAIVSSANNSHMVHLGVFIRLFHDFLRFEQAHFAVANR